MSLSITAADAQTLATAEATAIGASSTIEIRSGTKPATPETAATGTLLATVNIVGSFTPAGGSLTSADPVAVSAVGTGTAGYFRLKTSGGVAKIDGTVTVTGGGGDMQLASTAIAIGVLIDLGVVTFTVPVA
jgi:hypothetical protein